MTWSSCFSERYLNPQTPRFLKWNGSGCRHGLGVARFAWRSSDILLTPMVAYILCLLSSPRIWRKHRTTYLRTLVINCSWIIKVFQVKNINECYFMILTWIKWKLISCTGAVNHFNNVRLNFACCRPPWWSCPGHNKVPQYTDDANYFNLMINWVNNDC